MYINGFDESKIARELLIRKIVMIILISLVLISIIAFVSLYIAKIEFRSWVDINVFRKNVSAEKVPTIDLSTDKNNQIFCYSNYVCLLKDKNLSIYNLQGEKDVDISVNINTAIFNSNNKYLVVAEKNGQEFCVILDKTFLWKEKVDGEILQIFINKNGYVALITTDTTYKSIITLYNPEGKQVLKNFLSSSRIIDVSISNDNNYVAFAEIDSSGTFIVSNIKVISVEKAKQDSKEAIVYTYQAPNSRMITKIMYQDKNKLICMYDDLIESIKDKETSSIVQINNNISFASIKLNNHIAYIEEETTGLFNYNSLLKIINTSNNHETIYHFGEIAKEMYTYGNIIAINTGTEIYFINTSGMLIKKYTSNQEISNVILSNSSAIVIYKDRVEIINL